MLIFVHKNINLQFKKKEMLKYILLIIFITINILSIAQTGKIKVEVSKIDNNEGVIYIGIYNKPETFPKTDVVLDKKVKAKEGTIEYIFKNVSVGNYAVAIYHDEDENNKINRYFFGMPSEDYGFSRNPSVFGLPKYADCNFELKKNKIVTVRIKLK